MPFYYNSKTELSSFAVVLDCSFRCFGRLFCFSFFPGETKDYDDDDDDDAGSGGKRNIDVKNRDITCFFLS